MAARQVQGGVGMAARLGAAVLLVFVLAFAPADAAPAEAASPSEAHWRFEPDYRLTPPPDEADTPHRVAPPMVGPPGWRAPRLFQQDANDISEGLLDQAQPITGPFSVELWISDHVNHPVGALLAGDGPDGVPRWTLSYFSERGNDKFETGGALQFGPVERRPRVGETQWRPWRRYLHHLVGVFDGQRWRLYHNGVLVGTAEAPAAAFTRIDLAGYLAGEPYMRLPNLVREAAFHPYALSPAEVAEAFAARQAEIRAATRGPDPALRFTATPYLTPPGTRQQSLLWETNRAAKGVVEWGETTHFDHRLSFDTPDRLHKTALTGLKPNTAYFYRVRAETPDGARLDSGALSFRTMPGPDTPLVFAVTADTQERPFINFRLSQAIWAQRPHFLVLAGDLIGGEEDERRWHWTDEYFVGMGPLAEHVPVLAARGNGDVDMVDAATDRRVFTHFDRYHNQPDQGRGYYSWRIGDIEFFVLDGNLALRERQEPGFRGRQRAWLAEALKASTARWKIAVHHQPAYSSDEDDYGDSYTGPTTGGDAEIRQDFVDLYERYGVDLVLSGHIHSYERAWPLTRGRPACGGVTYLQVGGGGGDHERAMPTHGATAAATFSDFHFALMRVFGDVMHVEVSDVDGRPRDSFDLHPHAQAAALCGAKAGG